MRRLIRTLAAFAALPLAATAAVANPFAENLTARILPGWRGADGHHVAGLELTLAEGWKTYWRSPGEAGVPPQFAWTGSRNLAGVRVVWPRPEVFELNGLRSIGYSDRVVLPLIVRPGAPGQPVALNATVQLGICEDVCVPMEVNIAATLPPQGGRRDPAIAAAMAARPYSASEARVSDVACDIAPGRNGLNLSVSVTMPPAGGKEVIVVESADPSVWASDAATARQGGRVTGMTELMHASGGAFALDRSTLRITVLGRDHAVEIEGCDR